MSAHRIGVVLYALAVVLGGPAVVLAKRLDGLDAPLRVALALLAALGAALTAAAPPVATRALASIAAALAAARAFPALASPWLEGVEMAAFALALYARAREHGDRALQLALLVLAAGAFTLKALWAMDASPLVMRVGGLALVPVAIYALARTLRLHD